MSFPVNKYARYKRATVYFLNWLLRARGRCHVGQQVQLETFNQVVKEIAAEPSSLPLKLLQTLPKALAACRYAITLRENVSAFFSDEHEAQRGHRHFLTLLQNWHETLLGVQVPQQKVGAENFTFENYYQVLQADEDYFDDEVKDGTLKSAKMNVEPTIEDVFADEMKMEVVSFFMELDELMESVFKVYVDVKKEKRTLVEATVVAKVAIDTASALTAQLQLKYPSLRTGEDTYNFVRNLDPEKFRQQMTSIRTKYLTDLQNALLNGNGEVPYARGIFVLDFMEAGTTLASFLTAIPIDPTKSINFPHGCFGEVYGEDRTPQYVLLPDPSNKSVFLLQQLPFLHKAIVEKKVTTGSGYDQSAPMDSFMVLMEKYFTAREVTVPVVFACICWMKSVAALQGGACLGRNVSLTFQHSTDLMRSINDTLEKGTVKKAHNKSNDLLQLCAAEIKRSTQQRYLSRANPLLAGLTMLDHHFKYLHLTSEILLVTSRFRSFGHLYSALVKEGYLERIPYFDDVLEIYNKAIFTPSRNAAIHGAYYRTLLLSVDLRTASVDALCRGEALPAGNEKFKKRKAFHLSDVSKTFRLMIQNDKSVLEGASWTEILEGVADICSAELFGTCVLSRDLLTLNDDLVEVLSELCHELKEQEHYEYTIGKNQQRQMEDGVIMMLLQILDELESNRSLYASAMDRKVAVSYDIDTDVATNMCKKAAAVIRRKFTTPSLVYDQKHFTFPSQSDFVSQVYGSVSSVSMASNKNREQVFSDLMIMLKNSNGTLTGRDLNFFKLHIKADPELLAMTSCTTPRSLTSENIVDLFEDGDLCTLLHQAAAGPAHDIELVEWLIQMGALIVQPTLHCRVVSRQVEPTRSRMMLPNIMAVHSAAIAGYTDIVKTILEADNFLDLNTPTLHTKETLAHLAVKYGHRELLSILVWFGADLRIRDAQGRQVYAVTDDRDWSCNIAAYMEKVYRNASNDVGKREKNNEKDRSARRTISLSNVKIFKNSKTKTKNGKSSAEKKELLSAPTETCTISEAKSHLLQRVHTSPLLSRRCY